MESRRDSLFVLMNRNDTNESFYIDLKIGIKKIHDHERILFSKVHAHTQVTTHFFVPM